METSAIYKSIQSDARDAADLADEFINAKLPMEKVRFELIQLLVRSVGISDKIDENLIEDVEIVNVVEFVESKSKEVRESTIPLHNVKFFKRCVSFFERAFLLDWNTFANGGNFKTSYFINLLEELSECETTMMHVLCFAIRLKFVTAYLRGACVEDEQKAMPQVKAYAKIMVEKALFYRSIQCSISACTELYEWIKKDNSFATDRNLRLIVWSLKMEKPKLTCHSLLIAYSLLRMEHLRDQLTLFVRKLVCVFEDLCFIDNNSIFDWICRCCEPIYKYHRDTILPTFLEDLLDNLFAKSRSRAKSVAGFWINSTFDPNCHCKNIRTILKFLQEKGQEHWKVLVDSIIDDYPIMIDFKLLVEMLMDVETVPEEIRLTMEEKEGLLRLMSYAVEESVNGFPPEYRAENVKTLNFSTCHEYACRVTDAVLPRFWDLFHLSYKNKERAQIMLIFMAKFFNFAVIERTTMSAFVQECVKMLKTSCQAFCYQVVLDVLRLITKSYRDAEVQHLCESVFATLKNHWESQFIELIGDLLQDPDKYADSSAEAVRIAETILIRVVALNRVLTLNKECSFDSTRRLLQYEAQPRNPIFLFVLYVSVGLMCDHIICATRRLKEVCEEQQTRLEEYDDIMCDIDYLVKTLSIKLQEWYPWSDLSVATFSNLCKVLEAVKDLPLAETSWNILLPPNARYLITGFVAQIVWKANDAEVQVPQGTKTYILKAFLNLIKVRVLPLFYAYDIMAYLHKERKIMEEPLREFIRGVCAAEDESIVVSWISNWMTCLFQLSSKDCLDVVGDFVELIYPIRKEMQNIICEVDKKGIDFALDGDTKQLLNESSESRREFLDVIVKLSECLDDKKKNAIEKYFKETTFKKNDVKIVKNFLKRFKKRPASRKVDKPVSVEKPAESQVSILSSRRASQITPEESEPPWSPSSIARSNSVLADESDLGSLDSTDMSLFMVRWNEGIGAPSLCDGSKVYSTPAKDKTRAEDTSTSYVYDDVSGLIQNLKKKNNQNVKPPLPLTRVESTSQVCNDVSKFVNSLNYTTPANDGTSGKSSPMSASGENDDFGGNLMNMPIRGGYSTHTCPARPTRVLRSPIMPPQIRGGGSRTESTSHVYDNLAKFVEDLNVAAVDSCVLGDSSSPLVPSDDNLNADFMETSPTKSAPQAQANNNQTESKSQIDDNARKFVRSLNAENSSASTSSGDDDFIKKRMDALISDSDSISTNPTRCSHITKSPVSSPRTKRNDTEVRSTSQEYNNNMKKFLQCLNTDNSSPPASSGDDDFMKKRLNASSSDTDSFAVSPIGDGRVNKSPSSSPQANRSNIQIKSTSQQYDNMKKFVKSLNASSASVSSEDDDLMKNLSNYSVSEADLLYTTPTRSTEGAIDDTTDLYNILASDGEQHSYSFDGASKGVNDVAKNLQRVSLSNNESDETDSSSFCFEMPPFKKKRHS